METPKFTVSIDGVVVSGLFGVTRKKADRMYAQACREKRAADILDYAGRIVSSNHAIG